MRLTPSQRRVLTRLRDAEDAAIESADPRDYPEYEIVCEGLHCYIGVDRTSRQTVNALLHLMAISEVCGGGNFARYQINETGRNILADESQIDVLLRSMREGGAWTWEDGKLVRMK